MTVENDLISIIIPTFGRPKFLDRAIKSVLDQSYSNFEILIVDDNGKGTKNQLETYQKIQHILEKDNRLKYITHDNNLNGSAARNTGAIHAGGTYICFLDDDDEFMPHKLSEQLKKMNSLGNDWIACYTGHLRCFEDDDKKDYKYISSKEGDILYEVLTFKIDHVSGSSLMIRSEIFNEIDGWNEQLQRHQDYEFITKIANYGKIGVITEPLVKIHVHNGSNRHKTFTEIENTRLEYLEYVKPYIQSLSLKEEKQVNFLNNFWLLKNALKYNELGRVIYYFIKCKRPLQTTSMLIQDSVNYIKKNK